MYLDPEEKIKLRNNYLIKKRDAQKSRKPDSYIIEIEDVLEIPGVTITGIYNYNTGSVD